MRASWHEVRRRLGLTCVGTVYVLYDRRLGVLVLLLALLAASVGAMTVGMSMASERFGYDGSCLVTAGTNLMLVVWYVNWVQCSETRVDAEPRRLSPMAFETVLFAMTVAKFKQSRGEGLGRRPILDTMVQDGTWAFLVGHGKR